MVVELTNKCTDFTTPLFYILAPTCFGSGLPSSGSFLDPSVLLEIQIEWVVYHIMCGYVVCVPDCRGSVGTATSNMHGTNIKQNNKGYFTSRPMDICNDISLNSN
jgi:hypothetical protein